MAKIIVSSVQKNCQVAVIEVNPYLIAKAIRSQIILENIARNASMHKDTTDPETGETIAKVSYSAYKVGEENIKDLCEKVLPFVAELATAFEGEE